MSNVLNIGGVIGTDNVSPIYDPSAPWKIWNMSEIYLGTVATNKYVPKIGDLVCEITGLRFVYYLVQDINPATLVPVLARQITDNNDGTFSNDDILTGVGPGTPSDTYRIYLDRSVTPYRFTVDVRCTVTGSMTNYVKIFKGADTSSSGIVISKMYDTNGNFVSENVPLELAASVLLDNKTIKSVVPAYTTNDLEDGELVTLVAYNAAGFVVSKRQLLVENTAYIRTTDASLKYIVGIELKSPFMSTTDQTLIEYPINVPLNGLQLIGVVHYSNGDTREYPVDGTKFSIFGFDEYVATQPGQAVNLVLKYALDSNEYNQIATVAPGDRFISKSYKAITLSADGTYGVKLYPYPVWVDSVSGYRLHWFLYNLSRSVWYDVTANVVINSTYAPYNPVAYGQLQRLSVSVNLRDVNGIYKNYTHTQTVDVVIARQGTERLTNWMIGFSPDQSPKYGVDTYATAKSIGASSYQIKVNCGLTDQAQWLQKVYYATKPLYNPSTEDGPLVPTHFALIVNGVRTVYPLSSWNTALTVNQTVVDSSTVYVQFIRVSGSDELQLSVAGLAVWYVDSMDVIIV